MVRMIEFSFEELLGYGKDEVKIAGRCCRDSIAVGDVFTLYYERDWSLLPSDKIAYLNVQSVSLEVIEMLAYGRSLKEISPGLTAGITLRGQGKERLALGGFVSNVDPYQFSM